MAISDSEVCLIYLTACNDDSSVDKTPEEDCGTDEPIDFDCDSESSDKEVAELLGHSLMIRDTQRLCFDSGNHRQRLSAPLPEAAICRDEVDNKTICAGINSENHDLDLNSSKRCLHNKPLTFCQMCQLYYFCPINVSDATEVHHSRQEGGILVPSCRANRSAWSRSTKVKFGSRRRSECEQSYSPLPDVVPSVSDRPQSLPDIVALRQQYQNEMGRELRRIGDEFDSAFRERNARKVKTVSWNVFNCSLTFQLSGYLNTIRRFLSPTPSETLDNR